jgi:trimeric autotransporter adhesin
VTGFVRLNCPVSTDTIVSLSVDTAGAMLPTTITIPAGQLTGSFSLSLPVLDGAVTVTAGGGGATRTVVINVVPIIGSIEAGNGLSISVPPGPFAPGQTVVGRIALAGRARLGGVQVSMRSSNANGVEVPQAVHVPEGRTQVEFLVLVRAGAMAGQITVIGTSGNSTAQATLTIAAPGLQLIADLNLTPNPVGAGGTATGTVTLSAPAGAGGVSVTLSSNNGAASVPASLTIPQGQTSGTFAVSTTSVTSTQNATITATSANTATAGLTINPQPQLSGFSVSPSSVTGGTSATGTVTLAQAAPAGGATVTLSSSNGAAQPPGTVTVPAGQASASFTINTTPVSSEQTATLTASLGPSQRTAQLAVRAPCVGGLTLSVSSVLGGSGATGTVTLTGPAPAGGATVTLVSGNAAIQVPGTVTVPAGQTSAIFSVATSAVSTVVASTIQALFGSCPGVSVNLSVQAPVLSGFTIAPGQIRVGLSATGTLSLTGPAPAGGVTVNLGIGTPLGLLTLTLPASVTIAAGQTSTNFNIGAGGTLPLLLPVTINATSSLGNSSAVLTVTP